MNYDLDESSHPRFQKDLIESDETTKWFAHWLNRQGLGVWRGILRVSPMHAAWRDYSDNGDLYVQLHNHDQRITDCRVEVKGLGYNFTCRADWQWPNFMVCRPHSFDDADPKPLVYVNLNPPRGGDYQRRHTHAALIFTSTRPSWWVEEHGDRRHRNMRQVSYYAPLDQVIFTPVNGQLVSLLEKAAANL